MLVIQVGTTASFKLQFTKNGVPVAPPTTGGSIARDADGNKGQVALDADQQTVHYKANLLGTDHLIYSGPLGSGITAVEDITIVATTADAVSFDEGTFLSPDPNPPAAGGYH